MTGSAARHHSLCSPPYTLAVTMTDPSAATLDLYSDPSPPSGGLGGAAAASSSEGKAEDVVLEGTLTGTSAPGALSSSPGAPGFNTLDEPIRDTVLRDVKAVGNKFWHVLYPVERASLLRVSSGEGEV